MINTKYFDKFKRNPGISPDTLRLLNLPADIPPDYLEFLSLSNGGEGFIGDEYVVLFKAEELVKKNGDYKIAEIVPGIYIFGSNGGNEALAFDFRPQKVKYVIIPFIFEYDAIIPLGNDVKQFFDRIFEKGFFG